MVRLAKTWMIGMALLVLGVGAGYGVEFEDVPRNKEIWYVDDLYRLADLEAISGYLLPSGGVNFAPQRLVTRAEFLKLCLHVLSRGPGLPVSPDFPRPPQAPFPDVPVSAWYAGHVAFAKQRGITEAARVRFDPDVPVTRREAVGFVMRTLDLNGGARGRDPLQAFPDSSDPEVISARSARIIAGREDGLFHPNNSLNRAEAVALVARALRNLEDESLQARFELTAFTLDNPPLRQSSLKCPCPDLGIRLNQPVDNRNLIRVRLHGDLPNGGGTYYALHRSSNHIKVWPVADRSSPAYLDESDTHRFESGVAEDVFVENVTPGDATLSFELRRYSDDKVISRQTLVFKTLNLLVMVFGGRNQEPDLYDPENPLACNENGCGIFTVGEILYRDGYDAWLFNQEDIELDGRGPAYDFVRQAIDQRGVRRLALIGYSWGAGAVRDLAAALEEDAVSVDLEIVYTAYVDAIRSATNFYEHRRPPGSQYHLNIHQNAWHCYVMALNLCGIATETVNGVFTINFPINDTEWGKDLTHFFIDDPILVSEMIVEHFKRQAPK